MRQNKALEVYIYIYQKLKLQVYVQVQKVGTYVGPVHPKRHMARVSECNPI